MFHFRTKSTPSHFQLLVTTGLFCMISSTAAQAADTDEYKGYGRPGYMMMKELSPEQRATMAERMEKMAACLRSEKTMKDCHSEMRASCEASDSEMCPMMGGMHDMKMMPKGKKTEPPPKK
ncbi:MAG: hypothetical protein ACXWC9_00670 [Pseudobdellovibrionaceae bacterium]